MPSEVKPFGIGVIGSGPASQFVLERLSLRDDFEVVGWNGSDVAPVVPNNGVRFSSAAALIEDPRCRVVYLTGAPREELIAAALEARKHVVLSSVGSLSAAGLRILAEMAVRQRAISVLDEPRHWSDEALLARAALARGCLGSLRRIRLEVHELALPGESFPHGVLRELGWHWMDQLLSFVDDIPKWTQLRLFHEANDAAEHGFLALIDFAGGASAVIEVQTRSLLSLRTGWLLEGRDGAYRDGRYYLKTGDGEIVDEAVPRPAGSADPFFDALAAALCGDSVPSSGLSNLSRAVRTAELIEMLEQSSRQGGVIRETASKKPN